MLVVLEPKLKQEDYSTFFGGLESEFVYVSPSSEGY